jgi:HEAT repeat protein
MISSSIDLLSITGVFMKEDIPHLIDALGAEDELVRQQAAQKLGELRAALAVPALIERLDPNYLMHQIVLEALKAIGQSSVEALLVNLKAGLFTERVLAASALGYIQDTRAIPHLVRTICEDEMADVTWEAAMALASFGDKAVPGLVDALQLDGDVEAIIEALNKIGSPEALVAVEKWKLSRNA